MYVIQCIIFNLIHMFAYEGVMIKTVIFTLRSMVRKDILRKLYAFRKLFTFLTKVKYSSQIQNEKHKEENLHIIITTEKSSGL